MLKKILIAFFLILVGYTAAFFAPMPESIAIHLTSIGNNIDSKVNDTKNIVDGVGQTNGNKNESLATAGENDTDVANNAVTDSKATQSDTDSNDVFSASDLLFPADANISNNVVITLSLGTFPDQTRAENAITELNIQEPVQYYPYQKPTGTQSVLVTIGEFTTQGEAAKSKLYLENRYGVNLSVVKKPEKNEKS